MCGRSQGDHGASKCEAGVGYVGSYGVNAVRAPLETACYIFLSFGKIGQIPVAKRAKICILGQNGALGGSIGSTF